MDAIPWRLIQSCEADGPFNMGLDEALLRTASEHGTATLRLYTWAGPWVSLGYAQRHLDPERIRACEEQGVGIVRRTTGGRAVLHGRDLGYSIAAPEGALRPGLRDSYDQVATALLAAVRSLGVSAACRAATHKAAQLSNPFDCFAAPARDEIVVGTAKLVGSAQRRRGGAVLQHGSIRISADLPAVSAAAGVDPSVSSSLAQLGIELGEVALREALVPCFAKALGARFQTAGPERAEIDQAYARVELHRGEILAAPSSRAV